VDTFEAKQFLLPLAGNMVDIPVVSFVCHYVCGFLIFVSAVEIPFSVFTVSPNVEENRIPLSLPLLLHSMV